MKSFLKMKYLVLPVLMLVLMSSCTQKEELSEFDALIKDMNKDSLGQGDLDKILEFMERGKEETTVIPNKANCMLVFPVTNVKYSVSKQIINDKTVETFHYTANMKGIDDPNLAYQIDYIFMPEIQTEEEIYNLFKGQRDYLLSGTNSILEFEKIIELEGVEGRHLYFTVDESSWKMNYKMFFRKGVFYKLMVVTSDGHLFNNKISTFFDSFKFIN